MSKNVVIIGTQWGDEGKGKVVCFSILSQNAWLRSKSAEMAVPISTIT